MSRVIACKGVSSARVLIGTPTPVDVTVRGKRLSRGYKVWPIGINVAKSELYGWLRLEAPTDESEDFPSGYCHFPQYGESYFKELTAEHLVPIVKRSGFTVLEWQKLPGRENHFLDCRVYARAAASLAGIDRLPPKGGRRSPKPTAPTSTQAAPAAAAGQAPAPPPPPRSRNGGGWLGGKGRGGGVSRGGGGWLNRR